MNESAITSQCWRRMLLDNYMTSTGSILKCLAMMQANICHEIMIDIFVKKDRDTFGAMVHLGVKYMDNHQAGNLAWVGLT